LSRPCTGTPWGRPSLPKADATGDVGVVAPRESVSRRRLTRPAASAPDLRSTDPFLLGVESRQDKVRAPEGLCQI